MSDREHYELLTKTAARISERVGDHLTVKPSRYWSGGVQQTDYYDIKRPSSSTGPLNFWFAYGWLEGYAARVPESSTSVYCTGCGGAFTGGHNCKREVR